MVADAELDIRSMVDAHHEWLLVPPAGEAFPLNKTEIEIITKGGSNLFTFLDNKGFHSWRINNVTFADEEIRLDLAGAFGRNRTRMKLIPRTSSAALAAEMELARLKRANTIAEILVKSEIAGGIRRIELAKDNSRLAHIFFEDQTRELNCAVADVAGTLTHETQLASALILQERLSVRKKQKVNTVWIAAEKRVARNVRRLLALLNTNRRESVKVVELVFRDGAEIAVELNNWRMSDLWRERSKRLALPDDPRPTETAQRIIDLNPEHIDVIYSKQGESLRFMGLPFARVRAVFGNERAWFGVDKNKRLLTQDTLPAVGELVSELSAYRAANTENKRHQYYRQSPEAWLESILRRNIALLDANIILSPLYNQFRASNDRIDLLALRKDGRLVIIELKTSPDREMIFQAADYWRKIELQRRQGRLSEARLFGDRKILDKPALVYLAAPAWSFHPDFEHFARMLSKDIELWRFELHEDWRTKVKVVARRNYADPFAGSTNL